MKNGSRFQPPERPVFLARVVCLIMFSMTWFLMSLLYIHGVSTLTFVARDLYLYQHHEVVD